MKFIIQASFKNNKMLFNHYRTNLNQHNKILINYKICASKMKR